MKLNMYQFKVIIAFFIIIEKNNGIAKNVKMTQKIENSALTRKIRENHKFTVVKLEKIL